MEKIKTKICTKCKKEQDISCFHKNKNKKNGLTCWCKLCVKQYYKNNAGLILEKRKQYRKDNIELITKRKEKYYKNNREPLLKKQKQYYKDNTKSILEKTKQYYAVNVGLILKKKKQHYTLNVGSISKKRKQYQKNNALFETYSKQLEQFEEVRRCSKNLELLEVKCAYCGKWFRPTNQQVRDRIRAFNGTMLGEYRFYCSEKCKQSCSIYHKILWPKDFKQATSREVVPLLRQLVLKRDNYTCQRCGVTTKTAQLHVHHIIPYTQNKMQANDPDSCITFCKKCHEEIHKKDGCKYSDLRCPRGD